MGTEYWQPEAKLSQEKLTSYWERLNYCANKADGYKRDTKPGDLEPFAKEGNHCRRKPKDCKTPSNIFQYEAVPMKYCSQVSQSNASVKEQLEKGTYFEGSFCTNYGNWKFSKQFKTGRSTTTIWKCQDCSVKLVKQSTD